MISEFIFYILILHEITLQLIDSQGILRANEFWQFKYLYITTGSRDRFWMILIAVISCRNSKLLNHNVVVKGSSIKHHRNKDFFLHTSWCTSNLRASAILYKSYRIDEIGIRNK